MTFVPASQPSEPPSPEAWCFAFVQRELLLPDAESQVAYRSGVRHVARLVRQPLVEAAAPMVIDSEASYLITGGLGALGLQVAHSLVTAGARHLVLTGRSGAQGKEASVRLLEQAGARVHVYALDVADPVAVTAMLETIRTSLPPLRGIVHAAGVLDDATLVHQSSARLQRVMAPKVAGTWNLHRATAGLPLDAFVDLARAAVDDVAALGPASALTGPAARGDWATLDRHLSSIDASEHAGYSAGVGLALELAAVSAVPPMLEEPVDDVPEVRSPPAASLVG